jgi:hypothetical protein
MNPKVNPLTTQAEAIQLLDLLLKSESHIARLTAYERLRQLICLLIPE